MDNTLLSFRTEWGDRPEQNNSIIAWYDIAAKLHIPFTTSDINHLDTSQSTTLSQKPVIESMVYELLKESSIKTRRHVDTIASGLLPQVSSCPPHNTLVATKSQHALKSFISHQLNNLNRSSRFPAYNDKPHSLVIQTSPSDPQDPMGRPATTSALIKPTNSETLKNINKYRPKTATKLNLSNSNWIPDVTRLNSIGRDMRLAKDNLDSLRSREDALKRRAKRHTFETDLDKAHAEERCGTTKKTPCGCCRKLYLYVNLPKIVTMKAILDIRLLWSGNLKSETLFDPNITVFETKNEFYRDVPRCYDEVRVCLFCAQFFMKQEVYRPSYEVLVKCERKKMQEEREQREREYWDPLKMCEKNYDILENENPSYIYPKSSQ